MEEARFGWRVAAPGGRWREWIGSRGRRSAAGTKTAATMISITEGANRTYRLVRPDGTA